MSETKQMTTTHTPTPWAVGRLERQIVREVPDLCDSADCYILAEARFHGLLPLEEARANAAFIVEAVNSHEALKTRIGAIAFAMGWTDLKGMTVEEYAAYLKAKAAAYDACRANLDCLSRGQPKDTSK